MSEREKAAKAAVEDTSSTVIWTCDTASASGAVTVVQVNADRKSFAQGSGIIAITDEKICDSLGIVCPFYGRIDSAQSEAAEGARFVDSRMNFSDATAPYSHYASTVNNPPAGDSVLFVSDSGGMKLFRGLDRQGGDYFFHGPEVGRPGQCKKPGKFKDIP